MGCSACRCGTRQGASRTVEPSLDRWCRLVPRPRSRRRRPQTSSTLDRDSWASSAILVSPLSALSATCAAACTVGLSRFDGFDARGFTALTAGASLSSQPSRSRNDDGAPAPLGGCSPRRPGVNSHLNAKSQLLPKGWAICTLALSTWSTSAARYPNVAATTTSGLGSAAGNRSARAPHRATVTASAAASWRSQAGMHVGSRQNRPRLSQGRLRCVNDNNVVLAIERSEP